MSDETSSIIEFSEDIGEAEAPEPLTKGEYAATIRGAVQKVSGSGNRYAEVQFYIAPEDFPPDYDAEQNPDGLTVAFRRVGLEDNPRSRFALRRFCEAIGATMSQRMDLNDWVGCSARVTIDHDTYEGVTREQITRVSGE